MTNLEHATALLAGANYCGNEQTPSGAACARCIAKVLEDAYARGFAEAREQAMTICYRPGRAHRQAASDHASRKSPPAIVRYHMARGEEFEDLLTKLSTIKPAVKP